METQDEKNDIDYSALIGKILFARTKKNEDIKCQFMLLEIEQDSSYKDHFDCHVYNFDKKRIEKFLYSKDVLDFMIKNKNKKQFFSIEKHYMFDWMLI